MNDTPGVAARRTGRPTLDEAARLQRTILDETLAMLRTEGSEGFSIDRLVAKIGITKRTVYRHYQNKVELIRAVVSREVERLIQAVSHPEAPSGPPPADPIDDLHHWTANLFDYLHRPETINFYNYLCFEAASDIDIRRHFAAWQQSITDHAIDLIARAQAGGAIIPGNPRRFALLLLDLMVGQHRRAALGITPEELWGGDAPHDYFRLRWTGFLALVVPHPWKDFAALTNALARGSAPDTPSR